MQLRFLQIMKINNFLGELADISARKEPLVTTTGYTTTHILFSSCALFSIAADQRTCMHAL